MGSTQFELREMGIREVKLLTPFYVEDGRGYFLKSMEKETLLRFGLKAEIEESFETYSVKNVIRGMHFQWRDPQAKLVRAVTGTIWDVAVDLRPDSATFGKWCAAELTGENHLALWIPQGFAHGFQVLSEEAVVSYQCIGKYDKETDTGIRWDDPELAIDWKGWEGDFIISEKDRKLMSFGEYKRRIQGLSDNWESFS